MSDDKFPNALPVGSVLAGQFLIEEILGQGGFGITYKAKDHKTDESVAIKEYFPDTMVSRKETTVIPYSGEREENYKYGLDCFLQEAETLAKYVDIDGIVSIRSYFEENGTAYFVMDFVEGKSFDEYIKDKGGKIDYEDAKNALLPVIDALSYVHRDGIVHRDVTPDNIYITQEGKVNLLDFGAARYSIGDKSRSLDVVLKHGYAPKEQYTRHGKQGPFTDIYTVGVCFYRAITGKLPADSIDRLDADDVVPPSTLGIKIDSLAEQAILKAMAVQPQDRFQTMAAFKNALLGGVAKPSPSQIPPQQPILPQTVIQQPVVQQQYSHSQVAYQQMPQQPMYYQQMQGQYLSPVNPAWPVRSKQTAGLLAIFLGGLGVHKFYLGDLVKGFIYLGFCITCIPLILGIFEGAKIFNMTDLDFQVKYNVRIG